MIYLDAEGATKYGLHFYRPKTKSLGFRIIWPWFKRKCAFAVRYSRYKILYVDIKSINRPVEYDPISNFPINTQYWEKRILSKQF